MTQVRLIGLDGNLVEECSIGLERLTMTLVRGHRVFLKCSMSNTYYEATTFFLGPISKDCLPQCPERAQAEANRRLVTELVLSKGAKT